MSKINKVAIFGMGKSGKSALKLSKKMNFEFYAVNSGDPKLWWEKEQISEICSLCYCFSEEDFKNHFEKMDLIVLSPGIPLTHEALSNAIKKGVSIISEIEFAYQYTKDIPVIAITGSNGKTTTTTMIEEALKKAGKKVFCGGNIGIPYCDLALSDEKVDFAVIEVSSFQLETIKDFHPHIGLILNIFPNHSERYSEVHDYAKAKFRMLSNMTKDDHLILGKENPYLDDIKNHKAHKMYFTKGKLPKEFKEQFSFLKAKVRGEHNESNFYAAYEVLRLLQIPNLETLFQDFINEFKGVSHRLEFVGSFDGLEIYNDAKSTNSLATTTAINAFKDDPKELYLILGGKLRNEKDVILPDLVSYKNRIKMIFTIGEVSERLESELKNDFHVKNLKTLTDVLNYTKKEHIQGVLLFSPAFPSFDQFKNYVDRGEKFKIFVSEIYCLAT